MLSSIWMASSRVGVNTSAEMPLSRELFTEACIICNKGMVKAAVFPVPVCAQARRSLPESTTGMDFCWIGVGLVYPSWLKAFRIGSMSSSC